MEGQKSHTHSIQIDTDKCIGCSHCVHVCSTKAIRIEAGHAHIRSHRCIDCGECYRVCPQHAIYAKDSGLGMLQQGGYNIALLPSVFIGQFSADYSVNGILEAVEKIGFNEVVEVEQSVDFIKEAYRSIAEREVSRPLISSFCPAVVRLIQVAYPSLTEWIIPLKEPLDLTARYLRKSKEEAGWKPSQIAIYYITPCAAKIVSPHTTSKKGQPSIDGTIKMTELYNRVSKILLDKKESEYRRAYGCLSPDSVCWSLSGIEKKYFPGRSLAIDGMDNVIEFLEKLESGQIRGIDFLEMRACDQGCAGGILCPGNRFLTVERLEQREKKLKRRQENDRAEAANPLMAYREDLHSIAANGPILPRDDLQLDKNMERALVKLQRIERLMTYLPGFDCGACGAPTCRSLAEDIVQGKASISYCVFVQRVMEKNYKLSPDQAFTVIEKIWGKDRLNKYSDPHENEIK